MHIETLLPSFVQINITVGYWAKWKSPLDGNIPLVWPVEWVALGSQHCFYFGLIFAFVFGHHEEYEINTY